MLRKIVAFLLAMTLCLVFVGCSDNTTNGNQNSDDISANTVPSIDSILSQTTVGSTITFGSYDIDTTAPGKEELEWIVLDKKQGRVFVISKYVVAEGNFYRDDIWAKSQLRSWLYNDFTSTAFNSEEYQRILTTRADNICYIDIMTKKAYDPTEDKVYIPSFNELQAYGISTQGFAYADSGRVAKRYNGTSVDWVTRDTPSDGSGFCRIDNKGCFYYNHSSSQNIGIRPVMWLSYQ